MGREGRFLSSRECQRRDPRGIDRHGCGNQEDIDAVLISLDGTETKGRLGANAMLGVSMACLRAAAPEALWKHIAADGPSSIPVPQMNILNGGAHAASNVDLSLIHI